MVLRCRNQSQNSQTAAPKHIFMFLTLLAGRTQMQVAWHCISTNLLMLCHINSMNASICRIEYCMHVFDNLTFVSQSGCSVYLGGSLYTHQFEICVMCIVFFSIVVSASSTCVFGFLPCAALQDLTKSLSAPLMLPVLPWLSLQVNHWLRLPERML